MRRRNSITLWRNADFVKLWTGQTVSQLGSRITREGLPLTAVLALGAHPGQMGVLASLSVGAVLVFGLPAGMWVDRVQRRPVLIATDLGRALLLCSIPLAAAWRVLSMTQLYVVAATTGVLTVFFDVAYQSYLPALVSREQIVEGNEKLTLSSTTAEMLGPGITGVLVQWLTAPVAILLDAASFVFSAVSLVLIRRPETAAPRSREREHVWKEAIAGIRFIAGNPVLRVLAQRSVALFFCFGLIYPLYVLYAIQILGLTPSLLGLTIAMGGLGGVLGAMLSGRILRRFGLGATLLVTALIHGASVCLIPAAHGWVWGTIFLIGQQLFGDAAVTVYFIQETSMRQLLAPPEVLGRVNAGMQLASRGVLPLGALASGFLAGAIGIRPMLSVAAGGVLLSSLILLQGPMWKAPEA